MIKECEVFGTLESSMCNHRKRSSEHSTCLNYVFRHPVAGRTIVFITYGTCSLFSPRFCAICDIVPTLSNSFIPALIATMMVFRALIMYQFQLTKTVVLIVVGILVIVMSPLAVSSILAKITRATFTGSNWTRLRRLRTDDGNCLSRELDGSQESEYGKRDQGNWRLLGQHVWGGELEEYREKKKDEDTGDKVVFLGHRLSNLQLHFPDCLRNLSHLPPSHGI